MFLARVGRDDRGHEGYNGGEPMQMAAPAVPPWWREWPTAATAAERARIAENLGLIHVVCRESAPSWADFDDVISFCIPSVLKALRAHDPARGELSTITGAYIRNDLLRMRRCWHYFSGNRDNYRPPGFPHAPYLFGARCLLEIATPKPDREHDLSIVRTAFDALPNRHQKILSLWLGFDGPRMTIDALASRFGVSRQRIQQITANGLAKIAKACGLPKPKRNLANPVRAEPKLRGRNRFFIP